MIRVHMSQSKMPKGRNDLCFPDKTITKVILVEDIHLSQCAEKDANPKIIRAKVTRALVK